VVTTSTAPAAATTPAATVTPSSIRSRAPPPPPKAPAAAPTATIESPAATSTDTASTEEVPVNRLAKYVKMRQMLPEGAVRQKMMVDGFSQAEIDAFFSSDSADSTPTTASPSKVAPPPPATTGRPTPPPPGGARAPPPPPPKAGARAPPPPLAAPLSSPASSNRFSVALTSGAPTHLVKYLKMKEMLPEGAVRQKMKGDGYNEDNINAFFQGSMIPPPASEGGSKNSVGGGIGGNNAAILAGVSLRSSAESAAVARPEVSKAPAPLSLLDQIKQGQKLRAVANTVMQEKQLKKPAAPAGGLLGMLAAEMGKRRASILPTQPVDTDSDSGFSDSDSDSD